MSGFPVSTPSAEGVDAAGVVALLDALDAHPEIRPHGIAIQRHGRRIAEGSWAPHEPGDVRLVYSLSKSFTSTALALAVGDGALGLDDLVVERLASHAEGAGERTRRMRIRHIASMATGHDHETVGEAVVADPVDVVHGFLGIEPEHDPGTWFCYNQPPVLALATAIREATGTGITELLEERLGSVLGGAELDWKRDPRGTELGFSGLHTTLDAIARLGQLYLDDGVWDGERLLPEGWVADASRAHVDNPREPEVDWRQGYGFLFWMARHGYRGDGAFGQFMIVLPEEDTVVAIVSETERMQAVLDAVWEHLLPALAGGGDDVADAALAERLAALALPTAQGRVGGEPLATAEPMILTRSAADAGEAGSALIDSVEIHPDAVVLVDAVSRVRVPLDPEGGWARSDDGLVAVSGARDGTRVTLDVEFLEAPHGLVVTGMLGEGEFLATWRVAAPLDGRVGPGLAGIGRPSRTGAAEAAA